jgi:hypothetical protein
MSEKKGRPPKPNNVASSPRFKIRKKSIATKAQGGKKAALEGFRGLINAEPTPEYFTEFFKQVRSENNDRGAAILTVANIENSLRYALSRRLALGRGNTEQLFGVNGPMGTFDLKIKMAKALKVFGSETDRNLSLIRAMRNAFAHSIIPITFKTPAVIELCKFLVVPFVLPPKSIKVVDGKIVDPEEPTEARQRFTTVCENTSHNLFIYGQHCPQRPREQEDFGPYAAWLTPQPLP